MYSYLTFSHPTSSTTSNSTKEKSDLETIAPLQQQAIDPQHLSLPISKSLSLNKDEKRITKEFLDGASEELDKKTSTTAQKAPIPV